MNAPDGKEITDELLCKRFPRLFADRRRSMRETCMCWGFAVGPGWMRLIYDLAAELEPMIVEFIADHSYKNEFPSWVFSKVNLKINLQWRCYSFLAIWEWVLIGLSLRQPEPWWPRASQVKEKFGGLCFYMTSGTDEIYDLIALAENKSDTICETCGQPGFRRGFSWLYVSCNKHAKAEDKGPKQIVTARYKRFYAELDRKRKHEDKQSA